MPDDVKTSDPDFALESRDRSTPPDRENRDETPAPVDLASTSTGAAGDEGDSAWIEVTCGGCRRELRLRAEYLGRFVICQHCGQKFLARSDMKGSGDGKGPEDRSVNPSTREAVHQSPSGSREGRPVNGLDGFEKLVARIRRESRLERSLVGPGDEVRVEGGEGRVPVPSARPPDLAEERPTNERDSALAEAARLATILDEMRVRLAGLEARPPAESGRSDARTEEGEQAATIGRLEARIRTLEGELDRERAELSSALIRHREERDQLDQSHGVARARWDAERAGHPAAIDRARLEERAAGVTEREALRTRHELAQTRLTEEVAELRARVEQERRSAEDAERGRMVADHRAEGVQQERDALHGRCDDLEGRSRDLEARLAAQREEAQSAVEEAERLHRDQVDGLSRDLEQALDREQTARSRLLTVEGQVAELQTAWELERERSAADLQASVGDREDRATRLSEELAEARGRAHRDAAEIATLTGRVEELLSSLGREFDRAENEKEAHASQIHAVERQAEADRLSWEKETVPLRRGIEDAEKGRDAQRERADELARQADELAARLAVVEPALARLRPLEADVTRQAAELALARQEAAAGSRRDALSLEQIATLRGEVATLRGEQDARRRQESLPRTPAHEPPPRAPEPERRPDRPPTIEATTGSGDNGRQTLESASGAVHEGRDHHPGVGRSAVGSIEPAPATTGSPALAMGRDLGEAREISIVLQGVSKEYQRDQFRVPVLEDLDLTVQQGEFLALMGPSGSGKTTLLNLIAGLDRVSSGSIVVHGRELTDLSEAQLSRWRANNVGFVFQMYNLVPVMTAFRNVELPLLLTKLSRRQRRENALTALRLVGLEGREYHYPRQLSGGQEQRVSIARAIVTDPYLIVADEPTGDLDRKSADEILDLLGLLNREFRKTIVMVTHDPAAARRASRLLHLDKGKLVGDTLQPRIWNA